MILIGLGSNLTTDEFLSSSEILDAAIQAMAKHGIVVQEKSRFYETEPVPKSDQPWYVNAAIRVETKLEALELLKKLHEIEHDLGRTRRERWEARVIDLDLLSYNDEVHPSITDWEKAALDVSSKSPIIPHARMHKRDFVLIPLEDIAKGWRHPVLGKTIEKMLSEQKSEGIVRLL